MASEFADPGLADFQATDCWIELVGTAPTDCGWLTVPERWDRPRARSLRLPVVIFKPRNPDPSLDPVIYLSGGPGAPALGPEGAATISWRRSANILFPGRTLILFDQRGSGLGSPRLDCPEGDDPRTRWQISTDPDDFSGFEGRWRAALTACRDRLRAEGHDLGAFNSRQSAADVEALRHALGLRKVVLFGISYGTRLALTIMRHYPDAISAAVLDSVFPPNSLWPGRDGMAYGATLDRLFAACTGYERCAKAYPDLKARFLTSLIELAAKPIVLEIDNLESGEPLYARIDHRVFLEILRLEMYHTARIPDLPALLDGIAKGEHWRLRSHAENAFYGRFPRDYDLGMSLSVYCHDQSGIQYRVSHAEGNAPYSYLNQYVAWMRDPEACRMWQSEVPDPIENTAVVSAVPSLLLAGSFDGSTPVEWAEMAAKTLDNAHLFVFPATAHVQIFNSPCAGKILEAFLADPRTRPQPSCLGSLRKPAFLALGGG